MITLSDDGATATVEFPWPTNDTAGRVLRTMSQAALSALTAAGYTVTTLPGFDALVPAEGGGYVFRFTAPVTPQEVPS